MKMVFKVNNLKCAHCGAKIENSISRLPDVKSVALNFMTMRLMIECEDCEQERIEQEARAIVKGVEAKCEIVRNK